MWERLNCSIFTWCSADCGFSMWRVKAYVSCIENNYLKNSDFNHDYNRELISRFAPYFMHKLSFNQAFGLFYSSEIRLYCWCIFKQEREVGLLFLFYFLHILIFTLHPDLSIPRKIISKKWSPSFSPSSVKIHAKLRAIAAEKAKRNTRKKTFRMNLNEPLELWRKFQDWVRRKKAAMGAMFIKWNAMNIAIFFPLFFRLFGVVPGFEVACRPLANWHRKYHRKPLNANSFEFPFHRCNRWQRTSSIDYYTEKVLVLIR